MRSISPTVGHPLPCNRTLGKGGTQPDTTTVYFASVISHSNSQAWSPRRQPFKPQHFAGLLSELLHLRYILFQMQGNQQQPQHQQPADDRELPPNTSPQQPGPSRIWHQLQPELAERIISFLPPNEVACTVRLINKAAAAQFRGPGYTTVKLSSHVPPHAFKEQWERPGVMRGMSLQRRQALQMLTAHSGSLPNLQVAVAVTGILLIQAFDGRLTSVSQAAAEAGQLEMCQWLVQQGYPLHNVIEEAAGAGQQAICEWCLAAGCPWSSDAVYAAARGGHVGLMDWLLQLCPAESVYVGADVLLDAAVGCELHTLQHLYHEWAGEQQLDYHDQLYMVAAAARSSTPDWQDKLVWLETQGFPGDQACLGAASCPDALDRLRWLRGRGYPLNEDVALVEAAERGNLEVLQYLLLSEGVEPSLECGRMAARCGSLGALTLLHAHGCPMDMETVRAAARKGHLQVVVWLVEALGAALQLGAEEFSSAACSGNLELLRWLHERGCPWDADAIAGAAGSGCEEALEWLVEQGCPLPGGGSPYMVAARNNDLATLACLKRLGCPWGPPGHLLKECLQHSRPCNAVLSWLLAAGYPMTVEAALEGMQHPFPWRPYGADVCIARRLWGWLQANLGLQPPQQDP
ncbi:hypothetical protein Agub_g1417 [Astrephomene gubernaculifera]|uniref:Ankyrin repeat domain-containing protein n=1 Tax=Astrephomene gubernaculifera TaxID=47775 RepID=A0AAD3DFE3_9CHLO|nr:hypothetical protein Agub_g1417 [Astrephomene gubernaculifera]